MAKVDRMDPEIKARLLASVNTKKSDPLQQRIAEVFPNARPTEPTINNNGSSITGNPGTGNTGTGSNSTTGTTSSIRRSGDAQYSAGSSGTSAGTDNRPPTASTPERSDTGNQYTDIGTTKRNPSSTVRINRVSNPVNGETDRGNVSGAEDGSENRGNPRRGTIDAPELAVSPELKTRKPRTPKSEPIDIEMLTFGIQAIFAGIGTVAGPHWAISQDAALSIATPAKKCLDKLPASTAAKIEKYADPFAVCVATALVLSGPLQVEAMIANKQLVRGQLPTRMSNPAPEPQPQEPANVSNPTTETPTFSTNGRKPKSRFGGRFTNTGNVQGLN